MIRLPCFVEPLERRDRSYFEGFSHEEFFRRFERAKVLICEGSKVPMRADHSGLSWVRLGDLRGVAFDRLIYLGETLENAPCFALKSAQEEDHPSGAIVYSDLRSIMAELSPKEAGLAATALVLTEFATANRFCGQCGQPLTPKKLGWEQFCAACVRSVFPRTDPVVIMLITYGNDILLGRSPLWPEGMYSLLAGFVDPVETLEQAVIRETREEVGVRVKNVSYLTSQPWPFPHSLMLACKAEAETQELKIDPREIEDAFWISREALNELRAKPDHDQKAARKGSIARYVIDGWLKNAY